MQKEDLDYIEIILCEELQGIAMTKESTELAEYNDSIEKLKISFLQRWQSRINLVTRSNSMTYILDSLQNTSQERI